VPVNLIHVSPIQSLSLEHNSLGSHPRVSGFYFPENLRVGRRSSGTRDEPGENRSTTCRCCIIIILRCVSITRFGCSRWVVSPFCSEAQLTRDPSTNQLATNPHHPLFWIHEALTIYQVPFFVMIVRSARVKHMCQILVVAARRLLGLKQGKAPKR
jgi:hypothetical protein